MRSSCFTTFGKIGIQIYKEAIEAGGLGIFALPLTLIIVPVNTAAMVIIIPIALGVDASIFVISEIHEKIEKDKKKHNNKFFNGLRKFNEVKPNPSYAIRFSELANPTKKFVGRLLEDLTIAEKMQKLLKLLKKSGKKLTEEQLKEFAEFEDPITMSYMRFPVVLFKRTYDLNTLLNLQSPTCPFTREPFKYKQIKPVPRRFFDKFNTVYETVQSEKTQESSLKNGSY